MLNANKFLIFFFIYIFSSSLHAEERFDISGFYLGMSFDNVIKKELCKKKYIKDFYKDFANNKLLVMRLNCKQSNQNYYFWFDYNKKLYEIEKTIRFSVSPIWSQIENKLKSKYGRKYNSADLKAANEIYGKRLCFGECKWMDSDDRYNPINERAVKATMFYGSAHSDPVIIISMKDMNAKKKNDIFAKEQRRLAEEEKRRAESDIDF